MKCLDKHGSGYFCNTACADHYAVSAVCWNRWSHFNLKKERLFSFFSVLDYLSLLCMQPPLLFTVPVAACTRALKKLESEKVHCQYMKLAEAQIFWNGFGSGFCSLYFQYKGKLYVKLSGHAFLASFTGHTFPILIACIVSFKIAVDFQFWDIPCAQRPSGQVQPLLARAQPCAGQRRPSSAQWPFAHWIDARFRIKDCGTTWKHNSSQHVHARPIRKPSFYHPCDLEHKVQTRKPVNA